MVLAVDIGNTNVVVGYFLGEEICALGRLATQRGATELEYAVQLRNLMRLNGMKPEVFEGAILCSVVPAVTGVMKRAMQTLVDGKVFVVGPGLKTGLKIDIDNPAALGADRVADAVAAAEHYPLPLITIDMGTATTIGVVNEQKTFLGGMIVPGVMVSLNALTGNTSQLPQISLEPPKDPIGRNTVDCMRSGIIYHNAAGVDGMIGAIEAQLGKPCTVVATGGLAGSIIPYCKKKILYDPDLLLKGLRIIYRKNCK